MDKSQVIYLVFGLVVLLSLIIDLGIFSKKNHSVSIQSAALQTVFWVLIAMGFMVFIWFECGRQTAIEYLSAYLMEWSLSIDNVFVFIIIFSAFKVKEIHYGRVLLIGILMAIFLRLLFITVGVSLVNEFHWILYLFGLFLVYTSFKMFTATDDQEFKPQESKVYKILNKYLPLVNHDGNGRFIIREKGKPIYTTLFVVVILLGAIDFLFALDSLPVVLGISRSRIVVYSSNIFAVLGLRSLFFLLRSAISKFDYLQQGISFVLFFIGIKMLAEHWINIWLEKQTQVYLSLLIIVISIFGSILYSVKRKKKGTPKDIE
ncbi:MAG: TerC/Alx family metal homeostasis membrane protein [Bacteroidota bacterium]